MHLIRDLKLTLYKLASQICWQIESLQQEDEENSRVRVSDSLSHSSALSVDDLSEILSSTQRKLKSFDPKRSLRELEKL